MPTHITNQSSLSSATTKTRDINRSRNIQKNGFGLKGSEFLLDSHELHEIVNSVVQPHIKDIRENTHSNPVALIIIGGNGTGKTSQILPRVRTEAQASGIFPLESDTDQLRKSVLEQFKASHPALSSRELQQLNTFHDAKKANKEVLEKAIDQRISFITQTVGANYEQVEKLFDALKMANYEVHLHSSIISPEKALERLEKRNQNTSETQPYLAKDLIVTTKATRV